MARILVVDDEEKVRLILRTTLSGAGYQVEEAPNGKVALELYRQDPADLVITDIIMPEKEGLETILELRRDFPEARIIAMSGSGLAAPDSYLDSARRFGARHTFVKPVDEEALLEAVAEMLSEEVSNTNV
jgi:CheY-like chemotaxis protein